MLIIEKRNLTDLKHFARNGGNSTETIIDNHLIIKRKYKNNIFLYAKSLNDETYIKLHSPFVCIGFYNLPTDKFFNHTTFTLDDHEDSMYELKNKIRDEIRKYIADYLTENSETYFKGMDVPQDKLSKIKLDTEGEAKHDIFYEDETVNDKRRTLKDYIFFTWNEDYGIDVDFDKVLEYIETPKEMISSNAKILLEKRKDMFLLQYTSYKMYIEEYEKLKNDSSNVIHKKKRARNIIKDFKTVDLTIRKDNKTLDIKVKTLAFDIISGNFWVDTMLRPSRDKYIEMFKYDSYTFNDILKISHNGKIIYSEN